MPSTIPLSYRDEDVTGAIPGVEYDARTDERSFAAARAFLSELFDA